MKTSCLAGISVSLADAWGARGRLPVVAFGNARSVVVSTILSATPTSSGVGSRAKPPVGFEDEATVTAAAWRAMKSAGGAGTVEDVNLLFVPVAVDVPPVWAASLPLNFV